MLSIIATLIAGVLGTFIAIGMFYLPPKIKSKIMLLNNIPLLNTDKIYELLEYLSNKYELIAYSNWFTEDQEYRLERYDLKKFFKKVYGWDIIPLKPSTKGPLEITKGNIIEGISNLKTITTRSTGVDHIDAEYCQERKIAIKNVVDLLQKNRLI